MILDMNDLGYQLLVSPHHVLVILLKLTQLSLEINPYLDVQIPFVSGISCHYELTIDLLPFLASHVVTKIERCLFPMSRRLVRSCREPGLFMAGREFHIE